MMMMTMTTTIVMMTKRRKLCCIMYKAWLECGCPVLCPACSFDSSTDAVAIARHRLTLHIAGMMRCRVASVYRRLAASRTHARVMSHVCRAAAAGLCEAVDADGAALAVADEEHHKVAAALLLYVDVLFIPAGCVVSYSAAGCSRRKLG